MEASDDWYQTSCRSLLEYWQCEGDHLWNWKDKGYHTVLELLQVHFKFNLHQLNFIIQIQ